MDGAQQFSPLRIMILEKFGVNTYGVMHLYINIYGLVKDQMSQMVFTFADLFGKYIHVYILCVYVYIYLCVCVCVYVSFSVLHLLTERYHSPTNKNKKVKA